MPPEVAPELEPLLHHFWELSTSRGAAFSTLLPIPWPALDQYAHQYGYGEDEVDYNDFVYIIRALDEEFLDVVRKQAETSKKASRT